MILLKTQGDPMKNFKTYAQELDARDELRHYKKEFYLPKDTIYMDGNSLGLLSKRAEKTLTQMAESWKKFAIDGWLKGNHPWFYLAEKLGEMTAPLIGALPDEVVVTNSTTVNLHQLLATFFKPKGKRSKILIEELAFPSDVYAIKSQLLLHGLAVDKDLVLVNSKDRRTIDEDDIISSMTREIAIIILPTVLYRSGQLLNVVELTQAARKRNILIGFDVCHSIGVVPHNFHKEGVDFAFFCNYKYVNGGPGAEGGLFVHQKHFGRYPGLVGWFSSSKEVQFDMSHNLQPAGTAGAYQIGTPHILSMAPLLGALDILNDAGIIRIRKKSIELTEYMMELIDSELSGMGFSIGTPRSSQARGGHIALEHSEAARICKALKKIGVIPDFRPPNIIRLAPSPLYSSFSDVFGVVQAIKNIMLEKEYLKFENKRELVA